MRISDWSSDVCSSDLLKPAETTGQETSVTTDNVPIRDDAFILTETSTQHILKQDELLEPQLVIIDSVQPLYSAHIDSTPGRVSPVRDCTAELLRFAKESHVPVSIGRTRVRERMVQ